MITRYWMATVSQKKAFPATEDDVIIGGNVRTIRIARGLKMEVLARLIGVSWQQVQKYETGDTRLSANALSHFAALMRVPETAFFAGLDDPVTKERIPSCELVDNSENFNLRLLDAETVQLLEKLARKIASLN